MPTSKGYSYVSMITWLWLIYGCIDYYTKDYMKHGVRPRVSWSDDGFLKEC